MQNNWFCRCCHKRKNCSKWQHCLVRNKYLFRFLLVYRKAFCYNIYSAANNYKKSVHLGNYTSKLYPCVTLGACVICFASHSKQTFKAPRRGRSTSCYIFSVLIDYLLSCTSQRYSCVSSCNSCAEGKAIMEVERSPACYLTSVFTPPAYSVLISLFLHSL